MFALIAAIAAVLVLWTLFRVALYVMFFIWPGGDRGHLFTWESVTEPYPDWHGRSFVPGWAGNDYIVFSDFSEDGGEVYVASADGTELRLISEVEEEGTDLAPDVSPRGDRIVYGTTRATAIPGRGMDVETVDLEGQNRRRVTSTSLLRHNVYPQWAPDGKGIAFVSSGGHMGEWRVFLTRSDVEDPIAVLYHTPRNEEGGVHKFALQEAPAWSPDGKHLAMVMLDRDESNAHFVALVDTATYEADPVFRVPLQRGTWGRPDKYIPLGTIRGGPAWAPDSRAVAFLYHQPHAIHEHNDERDLFNVAPDLRVGWSLVLVRPDDQQRSIILLGQGHWHSPYLSWSPDGKEILLTRYGRQSVWQGDYDFESDKREFLPKRAEYRNIVALNADTGIRRTISQGSYASWSPDGESIAILGKVDDRGGHLATVRSDGSDLRVLVKADEDGDLELSK